MGALAVALGVGAAVATGLAAPASADTAGSTDSASAVAARSSAGPRTRKAMPAAPPQSKVVAAATANKPARSVAMRSAAVRRAAQVEGDLPPDALTCARHQGHAAPKVQNIRHLVSSLASAGSPPS